MEPLRFTGADVLSLIGVAQCVYILVYITTRIGSATRAGFALAYFLCLGAGFFLDFGQDIVGDVLGRTYATTHFMVWFAVPPLGALLIHQIAHMPRALSVWMYGIFALIPLILVIARVGEWYLLIGFSLGVVSLLSLWLPPSRSALSQITGDRYWVILTLILANAAFLGGALAFMTGTVEGDMLRLIRSGLGLAFIYLVLTSLLRIYPKALVLLPEKDAAPPSPLSDAEQDMARRIEVLLDRDKVYQETSYGRGDMARELGIGEGQLSRIVAGLFGKSLPQVLNERRVADAMQLLTQTKAPIAVIAQDVGFNSLASFNRVFRDITGTTPSAARKEVIESI